MKDRYRLVLAVIFALVFALTVVVALGVAVWGTSEARSTINSLLSVLLPAELTLLAGSTAYYFERLNRKDGLH